MRACPACLSVFASEPEFCVFDGHRLGPEDTLIGRNIDGYRFEEVIGVGGTSCVFRAVHRLTEALCAIKILYGEMATDLSVAERFRREAEAVRAIDHPNVVKILDTGTLPAGLPYMVMELVDGPTLKTLIEREAPLPPRRAGRLAEQMVAGLADAHHKGFVHRDLKPGNIIVGRTEHGAEQVKLLDFGIVASIQTQTNDRRLTKTGYIVGTPTYMAPEQVDPKAVSPQTDVYALGVILYELLAGEPPFTGTLEQILVAKMTERPAPLPDAGELGRLVLSMLESDARLRPADALLVSAELNRISLMSDQAATVRGDAFPTLDHADFAEGVVKLVDNTTQNEAVPLDSAPSKRARSVRTAPNEVSKARSRHRPPSRVRARTPSLAARLSPENALAEAGPTSTAMLTPALAEAAAEQTLADATPLELFETMEADAAPSPDAVSRLDAAAHPDDDPQALTPANTNPTVTPRLTVEELTEEDSDDELDQIDTEFKLPPISRSPFPPHPSRGGRSGQVPGADLGVDFRAHDPVRRPGARWMMPVAVALLLTLSALLGFLLASKRQAFIKDVSILKVDS